MRVFFGDERCVPPENDQSNYRMAADTLLQPRRCARRERAPYAGAGSTRPGPARRYADDLRAFFGADPPSLDLVLLGMGDNGHTASLFPGLAAVHEQSRWVMAEYVAEVGMWRITLTPAVLNAARSVAFLAAGTAKASMLRRVLEAYPAELPAQVVRPTSAVLWLVDAAAAAEPGAPPG